MAYVEHISGEQLSQTRAKAQANFVDAKAAHAGLAAVTLIVVGSGMGLEQFREACRINFIRINAQVPFARQLINDGDMIWTVRDKLNNNFSNLEAELP